MYQTQTSSNAKPPLRPKIVLKDSRMHHINEVPVGSGVRDLNATLTRSTARTEKSQACTKMSGYSASNGNTVFPVPHPTCDVRTARIQKLYIDCLHSNQQRILYILKDASRCNWLQSCRRLAFVHTSRITRLLPAGSFLLICR